MGSLLTKFKEIEVKSKSLISEEDQKEVDKCQEQYLAVIKNLEAWHIGLKELEEKLPRASFYEFQVNRYRDGASYSVDKDFSGERGGSSWHDRLMFTPAYSYCFIEEARSKAVKERNEAIVDYFNGTYNLEINISRTTFHLERSIDNVVQFVLLYENNGLSLVEKGIARMKERVKDRFYKGAVTKNKIIFPKVYLPEQWSMCDRVESIGMLISAISYFETGTIKPDPSLVFFFNQMSAGQQFNFDAGTKFKGFKFFKNHKTELTFTDNQAASDFLDMFHLGF